MYICVCIYVEIYLYMYVYKICSFPRVSVFFVKVAVASEDPSALRGQRN